MTTTDPKWIVIDRGSCSLLTERLPDGRYVERADGTFSDMQRIARLLNEGADRG